MPGAYEKIPIHHLLSTSFHGESAYPIQRLPIQLFIDNVIPYLSIGDTVALRKVNSAFFLLTHEPIIWRRFLQQFNVPPPYISAYAPHTLQASDFKVESMIANLISVQQNWESPNPQLFGYCALPTLGDIVEMKILPGGEYGVCAVRDAQSYRVMVTEMNGQFASLASLATLERPYKLQAQYMSYNGRVGIMVWFLVEGNVEYPTGLGTGYTCHIAHIGLDSLSLRSRKDELSLEPFELMVPYTFQSFVHDVSVFLVNDELYVAPILLPNEVLVINVDRNEARSLLCSPGAEYEEFDHQIRAMRVLPEQGDVMVIRTVVDGLNDTHLLELYSIPQTLGRFTPLAKSRVVIDEKFVKTFSFSERPTVDTTSTPLPLSLFVETENPRSIVHYSISPVLHSAFGIPRPWWSYDLTNVIQQSACMSTQDLSHVLPGAHRALVCTISGDDNVHQILSRSRLTGFRRYFNPEMRYPQLLSFPRDALLRTQQLCGLRPKHLYRTIDISPHILNIVNQNGITSIAWDETSGRTCITTQHDGRIHMLDFGRITPPYGHIERFDNLQKILRIGEYENATPESPYPDMIEVIDMEEPDDLYTSSLGHFDLFAILTYCLLGLTSIISLYSSLSIRCFIEY